MFTLTGLDPMSYPSAPLANVFTLGVRNLPAMRDFYQKLGWRLVVNDSDYAAFELRGSVLALFLWRSSRLMVEGSRSPVRAASALPLGS